MSRPVHYHAPAQRKTRPQPRRYRCSGCDGGVGARRTSPRCALHAQRLAEHCTVPKNAALCEREIAYESTRRCHCLRGNGSRHGCCANARRSEGATALHLCDKVKRWEFLRQCRRRGHRSLTSGGDGLSPGLRSWRVRVRRWRFQSVAHGTAYRG